MRTLTPFLYLVVLGGLMGSPAIKTAAGFNYGDALAKTLTFFEAQRSGKLPTANRVSWRGDSALTDGFQQHVNLVGGYYDAGDHVKFGFPMAFTMTMISWAAVDFRHEIAAVNQLGNTLDAIRWGTDYLIKAHTQRDVLWGQVGDGYSDHACWERPEDMRTPRTAYSIDAGHPGSDLAGETAAAMAAASLAFKPYNSTYSSLLLSHAIQLFTFADTFRGLYDDSISSAHGFYPSSGYTDELLWAASWLFRATGEEYYLSYVVDNAVSLGGTGWAMKEFSWDNKYAGLQILLSKVLLEGGGGYYSSTLQQYKEKADYFACAYMQKNDGDNVDFTPGGLVYVREWNNLQYASSAAFLLAVYSDYLSAANAILSCPNGQVQPQALMNLAQSQADYILGKNPKYMSYLVGFGENYPVQVHHRGASIPSIYSLQSAVSCVEGFEDWYNRPDGNPNVLFGGLVGGPDQNDGFLDERSNYEQSEATISGTGPLVGLFSKLQSLNGNSGSHSTPSPVQTPKHAASPVPRHTASPKPLNGKSKVPVVFLHSITATWKIGQMTYYRHRVVMKNTSNKPITYLQLAFKNLSGPIWGLSATAEKNIYLLPQWIKVLKPGSQTIFVYVQGGPQAKVSVVSYH